MKNNLLKGMLFIALAGLITFTGCKYEEGPGISIKSKRDRFSNEWKVNSYTMLDSGASAATDLSNLFDTNSTSLGDVLFVTTRTGRFSLHQVPDTAYEFDSVVWNKPVYLQMKKLTSDLSSALGFKTSYSSDTNDFVAPAGEWTFDDKSSTVQMKRDLSHIDSIPNIIYDIVELREDALKLKWTDGSNDVRTIGFTPVNDEDFFL
mgnify:CR=1 FL=1